MTEALAFAAAMSLGGTLDRREGQTDAVAWGIIARWSGHEWRICPECHRSALVSAKAKNPRCRLGRGCEGRLVDADTYARATPDRYGPCARDGCDRPALAHGACAICAHLLAHPQEPS